MTPSESWFRGRATQGYIREIRLRYVRWRYRFGPEELLSFLMDLGLRNGDVVLTHISYDRFAAFTGKPTDVIDCLQRVVGNRGTLLMPTIPFTGLAVEYVREGKIFDVLRTPSQMGLVTETFRRMPGVVRSVHPTHPVAAWGARVQEMISGHENCSTPCGRQSPYGRLLDREGKILLLGTGIRALTFFHTAEEILEPGMPFSPFTREYYSLKSRTREGNIVESNLRLFDPDISRKRNIDKLVPALKRRNALRRDTIGTVEAILLEAREVLDVLLLMAEGGQYCYDP